MEIRSIGRTLIALGTAAALLTGCGGKSDKGSTTPAPASASPSKPADNGVAALDPAEIINRAKAALKVSKSFHIAGKVTQDEQETTLDFKIADADLVGSMAVDGAKVQLLRVGGKHYMKPDAAFWKVNNSEQADAVIELVGDRWVEMPAEDEEFGVLFAAADIDQLLTADGTVTKGAAKTIAGVPTIGLVDDGPNGGILYVATTGEPYPLQIDGPTAAAGGLTISEFGATFTDIKAPAATDVLDLAKLGI